MVNDAAAELNEAIYVAEFYILKERTDLTS
jgi:hypothetical protein